MKQRKIDRVINLKLQIFDLMRKFETLQNLISQLVKTKDKRLKELQDLEAKLIHRYSRAKKLVNR